MLSNGPNEAVNQYLRPNETFKGMNIEEGSTYEISPKSIKLAGSIAQILDSNVGAALIMDYGENQAVSDSVRVRIHYLTKGIYKHKYIPNQNILDLPGEVDLSAYVNFKALQNVATPYQNSTSIELIQLFVQKVFLKVSF